MTHDTHTTTNAALVERFAAYLAGERRYSPLTVRNYRHDMPCLSHAFILSAPPRCPDGSPDQSAVSNWCRKRTSFSK